MSLHHPGKYYLFIKPNHWMLKCENWRHWQIIPKQDFNNIFNLGQCFPSVSSVPELLPDPVLDTVCVSMYVACMRLSYCPLFAPSWDIFISLYTPGHCMLCLPGGHTGGISDLRVSSYNKKLCLEYCMDCHKNLQHEYLLSVRKIINIDPSVF